MSSVIEELYKGNINPNNGQRAQTQKQHVALNRSDKLYDELQEKLDETGKALLEEYISANSDVEEFYQIEKFSYGLKLGVMLMAEVFTGFPRH